MAGKKLGRNVNIGGELYEAGSTPPKEIADQITNPNAWELMEDEEPEAAAREAAKSGVSSPQAAKKSGDVMRRGASSKDSGDSK